MERCRSAKGARNGKVQKWPYVADAVINWPSTHAAVTAVQVRSEVDVAATVWYSAVVQTRVVAQSRSDVAVGWTDSYEMFKMQLLTLAHTGGSLVRFRYCAPGLQGNSLGCPVVGDTVGQPRPLPQPQKVAPATYRDSSQRHAVKAPLPMLVTEPGIVTSPRREQNSKALVPRLVTEFPIVRLVRPVHFLKVLSPTLMTKSGIVTLASTKQSEKA